MTLIAILFGTLVAGDDPRRSVVGADGRVHGMENLYVAGSSVFATAGQCTPTTTSAKKPRPRTE